MPPKAKIILLTLLVLLGYGLKPNPRPVAAAQGGRAGEIMALVNDFRASLGLPNFTYNPALAAAAQRQANWMASAVKFSHTGDDGSTPKSRAADAGYIGFVVENIVGGSNMTPRQGLIWWQNSPIHYNTLVTTRYAEAGTGYATNGTQHMYVLVVGRPPGANENVAGPADDISAEPLIVTPITLAEPRDDGSIVHVVQQGQALWSVAAYYEVKLDHLYLINGFRPEHIIQPGDEVMVRLPDGQAPPPTPTPPTTHIVQEGQSAWTIASLYGIKLDTLLLLNGLSPDAFLQPGDELQIRLAEGQSLPPTPTPRTTHIVQSGQSAWTIAALYGLSVLQLLELNGLAEGAILQPGDELRIRALPPTPTPTATQLSPAEGTAISPTVEGPATRAASQQIATGNTSSPDTLSVTVPLAGSGEEIAAITPDGQEGRQTPWAAYLAVALMILAGGAFYLARRQPA